MRRRQIVRRIISSRIRNSQNFLLIRSSPLNLIRQITRLNINPINNFRLFFTLIHNQILCLNITILIITLGAIITTCRIVIIIRCRIIHTTRRYHPSIRFIRPCRIIFRVILFGSINFIITCCY